MNTCPFNLFIKISSQVNAQEESRRVCTRAHTRAKTDSRANRQVRTLFSSSPLTGSAQSFSADARLKQLLVFFRPFFTRLFLLVFVPSLCATLTKCACLEDLGRFWRREVIGSEKRRDEFWRFGAQRGAGAGHKPAGVGLHGPVLGPRCVPTSS